MSISDFAIRRPIVTIVAMLGLVIFGLFALSKLEVDEFPDLNFPIVSVAVPYPGASPEQVEREIVDRMEDAFSALTGVDQMSSKSFDGFAQITVQFGFDKNTDQASQDVRDAISGIRGDLPPEMEEPIIRKFDPTARPIISLVLSSKTMKPADLTLLADPEITQKLQSIQGVAQVTLSGRLDREILVNLRPADLQATGVSIAEAVAAVQAQSLAAPVGSISNQLDERSIRLKGRLESPAEFQQLVVASRGGQLLRLGQLADVSEGTAEQRTMALYNGEPAIGIDITKSKGSSTMTVSDLVKESLDALRKGLPEDVRLEVVRDSGRRVRASVTNVEETIVEGALLTVLVVFLFLNSWRSTVITGLALPVSILAAFVAIWAMGFTLNTMSLMGLSLAIGILIDDAIVVRENIVRHVEMGKDHLTAAHEGTREIGLAVAATTFSIVAVFVPIGFMDGIAGQWFKPFALTIASAVLVSLLVSFSLDPMLSAYWPDPSKGPGVKRGLISRALDAFNHWFDRQSVRYRGVIAWALDHRWSMVLLTTVSFVGAIVLQVTVGGSSFTPVSDRSEVDISFETAPGSSLEYTRIKAAKLDALVRAHPEVAYTYVSVGSSDGSGGVDSGSVYARLVPKSERGVSQSELSGILRKDLAQVGGATASVASGGGGGGGGRQISVQLRGNDGGRLQQAAEMVFSEMQKVQGVTDLALSTRGQKPEIEIELDRGMAGSLGLTVREVAMALRTAFAGVDAGDWVDSTGETRDVRVRLEPAARGRRSDLEQLPLVLAPGAQGQAPQTVPLGQVAKVRDSLGPARIDHLDGDRVIAVEANVQGRSLGEVMGDLSPRLRKLALPAGVSLSQGGEAKNQNEVFSSIFAALGTAVLLMYFILVVQFGSFLDPLAILVAMPLSLIGVVLALLVLGDTLNLMSLIGVMLLMGIVVKNAILLIDFAKWNHEAGKPLRESLIEAGQVRLRPILMTTLALIAGMIPVALGLGEGADFRAPLGRAVIGGTITSTALTLLVIPTIYEILCESREKAFAYFGRKRVPHVAEGTAAAVDLKNLST